LNGNWQTSFDLMIVSEGGFSNDPRDDGNRLPDGRPGSTMLGVTQYNWEQWTGHQVTHEQMKKLTPADVKPFYKRKFWDACRCDDLPLGIDYLVFDMAVNAGVGMSAKLLQHCVGVSVDGAIGPITITAVKSKDPEELVEKFSEARELYYRGLKKFGVFGKGWLNRVEASKIKASSMLT